MQRKIAPQRILGALPAENPYLEEVAHELGANGGVTFLSTRGIGRRPPRVCNAFGVSDSAKERDPRVRCATLGYGV